MVRQFRGVGCFNLSLYKTDFLLSPALYDEKLIVKLISMK
jgi:hypothetical protein